MSDLRKKIEPAPPEHARKRVPNKNNWKTAKQRRERYSAKHLPSFPNCKHKTNCTFKCLTLKTQDIARFHNSFYKLKNKTDQDNFILKHSRISKCSRTRLENRSRGPKNLSAKYYITIRNPHKQVRVCKSAFIKILQVGKDRVTGVLQRSFKDGGSVAKENRGGDHKKTRYAERHTSVTKFIESIEAAEPHYCRAKSSVRVYLPPELNIKKLWKIYEQQVTDTPHLKVKHSFFRNIFNRKYNVGFGSPLKDTCSKCFELKRKIETASNDQEKQSYIAQKRLHSLKAKAFYDMLKNGADDTITLSFDCQKNSPLPKLPDQAAYFSRQFNMYNFTVVIGTSKSALDNVRTYYWSEDEHPKSSSEIASAVFDTLISLDIPSNKTRVRLFADGCGGQNKNTTLVGMCAKWLFSNSPPHVQTLEVIFPMVGHSFLPPDRVFAKIEKESKKMSVICDPKMYVELFRKHASIVRHLGEDVEVYDWKNDVNNVFKPPGSWHFKFNPSKRFLLHKGRQDVSIQGEENYRSEFSTAKFVTKKGKSCSELAPAIKRKGNKINIKKINDVANLLSKHFGEDWRTVESLTYYRDIEVNNDSSEEQHDLVCVRLEENENFV